MSCNNLFSGDRASVGAIGFEIFIATGLDLSSASGIEINWRAPDLTSGSWVAVAATKTGEDGTTVYGAKFVTTSANDLDQPGSIATGNPWELQVSVVMPGFSGAGEIAKFEVIEAL